MHFLNRSLHPTKIISHSFGTYFRIKLLNGFGKVLIFLDISVALLEMFYVFYWQNLFPFLYVPSFPQQIWIRAYWETNKILIDTLLFIDQNLTRSSATWSLSSHLPLYSSYYTIFTWYVERLLKHVEILYMREQTDKIHQHIKCCYCFGKTPRSWFLNSIDINLQ